MYDLEAIIGWRLGGGLEIPFLRHVYSLTFSCWCHFISLWIETMMSRYAASRHSSHVRIALLLPGRIPFQQRITSSGSASNRAIAPPSQSATID